MKKVLMIAALAVVLAGCVNNKKIGGQQDGAAGESVAPGSEEMIEYGMIGYADIVSFIVQGYQCRWDGMGPDELGLSLVYMHCSPYAGFTHMDIDGDGINELVIGDEFEDGTTLIYDIYTINPEDGSLIHLVKGGERDVFRINGDHVLIEEGSNSAFDSFTKVWKIAGGQLVELKDVAYHDSALAIGLEKFVGYTEE